MVHAKQTTRFRFWLWLIRVIGVTVPQRLRADWQQEWEAELRHRELLLAQWDRLDWRNKFELVQRSTSAFWDALWLQHLHWEDAFIQDVRYGLRMLVKSPGFTSLAVVTLALGIGANTAIFSVVHAVLLRPLPFADPDRLALVWQTNHQGDSLQLPFAFPNFHDLAEQCQSCESVGAWNSYSNTRFALTGGSPEEIQYSIVSSNLFAVLGVKPILGRPFLPEEDQLGTERVAIISEGLWRRRWAADPELIGQAVALNGESYTVVGIMPAGFVFPKFPKDAEVWVPLSSDPVPGRRFSPGTRYLNVIVRIKKDISLEQAQSEMEVIAARIEQQRPEFNRGIGLQTTPFHQQLTGHLRPALLVLLGAVGFVLLIACANVGNLLTARAMTRDKEIAVRLALGATRLRLLRQLLTESMLLALLSGLVGWLLAILGTNLLSLIPYNEATFTTPYTIPTEQIALDGKVLGFTVTLSLLTGLIFGLAPAIYFLRPDLQAAVKGIFPRYIPGFGRESIRHLLVAAEVALSLVLLIGAGLMIRSFVRLQRVDPGFEPEHVMTAQISLPRSKYDDGPKVTAFYQELQRQLTALPRVESVGAISSLPLSGTDTDTGFFIKGQPILQPRDRPRTHPRTITPDYFRAMGVVMLQGRTFTEWDHSQAQRVAIINEKMARLFWPGESPIGKHISLDFEAMRFFPDRPPEMDLALGMREIVGVVRDVRHLGLQSDATPEMFIPAMQRPEQDMNLVIRASGDTTSLATLVRTTVLAIDPDQPVAEIRPMSQILGTVVAKPRFNYLLLTIFGTVALILSATGVYGVMTYAVTARTREIGIRMALGAQAGDVLKLVVLQGMKSVFLGVALGLAGAGASTRVMTQLLFDISPTDPFTFTAIAALSIAVAFLASYLPARRATRVDPTTALRYE